MLGGIIFLQHSVELQSFFSVTEWLIYGTIYQFVQILQVSVNLTDRLSGKYCKANFTNSNIIMYTLLYVATCKRPNGPLLFIINLNGIT